MKRQLFYFFLFMCLAFPLSTTAQVVDIPDLNLRAAIESTLGVASGGTSRCWRDNQHNHHG